jgi:hypothetical protein
MLLYIERMKPFPALIVDRRAKLILNFFHTPCHVVILFACILAKPTVAIQSACKSVERLFAHDITSAATMINHFVRFVNQIESKRYWLIGRFIPQEISQIVRKYVSIVVSLHQTEQVKMMTKFMIHPNSPNNLQVPVVLVIIRFVYILDCSVYIIRRIIV